MSSNMKSKVVVPQGLHFHNQDEENELQLPYHISIKPNSIEINENKNIKPGTKPGNYIHSICYYSELF